MNYFKIRRQIIIAMLLTSICTCIRANETCFQADKQILLDATNFQNWYNTLCHPYVYMFNNSCNDCWIEMSKCTQNDKYFSFTVPSSPKYSELVFTLQISKTCNWDQCKQQTVDISCDNSKNFYIFDKINNEGKITGHWDYIDISNKNTSKTNKQIFLDTTKVPDWNNPHIYVWNKDGSNCRWIKMNNIVEKPKCFSGIIPSVEYCNLIFTSQNSNRSDWPQCNKQTVNITLNNDSNCYILNGEDSNGKLTGNWNNITITDNTDNNKIPIFAKLLYSEIKLISSTSITDDNLQDVFKGICDTSIKKVT